MEIEQLREKIESVVSLSDEKVLSADSNDAPVSSPLDPENDGSRGSREFKMGNGESIHLDNISKTFGLWECQRDIAALQLSMSNISTGSKRLRTRIKELQEAVANRRAAVRRRTDEAAKANHDINAREESVLNTTNRPLAKATDRASRLTEHVVLARKVLCREVGLLAGLKKRSRPDSSGAARHEWILGKVRVWDIRHIHEADPVLLNASLSNVARLVVWWSRYLGLQLPAQIILNGEGDPLPRIFNPQSSYRLSAGNGSSQYLPRPRPLYLTDTLMTLRRDHPTRFANFIEGVTLLAWDVAWMCRVCGVGQFNTWESICDVGANLNALIEAARVKPTKGLSDGGSGKTKVAPPLRKQHSVSRSESTEGEVKSTRTLSSSPLPSPSFSAPSGLFGLYSHAMSFNFLGHAEPARRMLDWELISPTYCLNQVDEAITAEIPGYEWDMLDISSEEALAALMEEAAAPVTGGNKAESGGDKAGPDPVAGSSNKNKTTVTGSETAAPGRPRGESVSSRLVGSKNGSASTSSHALASPRSGSAGPAETPSRMPSLTGLGWRLMTTATSVTNKAVSVVGLVAGASDSSVSVSTETADPNRSNHQPGTGSGLRREVKRRDDVDTVD